MLAKGKCYVGYDDDHYFFGLGPSQWTQLLRQAFPSFPVLFVDCTKSADIKVLAKIFKLKPSG